MEKKQIKSNPQPSDFFGHKPNQKSDCLILQQLSLIQKNLFSPNKYLWIDQNIHNLQNQQIFAQLKTNEINPILFSTIPQAQQQVKKHPKDIFRIISSAMMGEAVCKQFHQHKQVIHIYIFCGYKPAGQVLQQKWNKIKFHTADVKQFLIKLKQQSRCDNRFSELPSFMKITTKDNTHDNTLINNSKYNLHGLFLFKDRMQAKLDFLKLAKYFYEDKSKTQLLQFLKEYPIDYNHQLALNWYTRETFFYKLLNNFLRSSSNPLQTPYLRLPFDATFKAIKQIYDRGNEKKNITVYRGGFMNDNQLEYLEKNVGQYIEMFGFMSTSTQIDIANKFIKNYKGNSLITILIQDQKRQQKIDYGYANITKYSKFNESQMLFNALNVFKVVSYRKQDGIHHITLKYGQLARIVKLGKKKLQQKQKNILINYKHQQEIISKYLNNQGDVFHFCQMYNNEVEYRKKNILENQKQQANLANQLINMGTVYLQKNEYNRAIQDYQQALKIYMNVFGENHNSTATALSYLGIVYQSKAEYNKALQYFLRSLKININIFASGNIIADILLKIGNIYGIKAEYNKGLQYYQRAIKIDRNILQQSNSITAGTLLNFGKIYLSKGEYNKALEYFQKSLKISMNIYGENHTSTALVLQNIGIAYHSKGQYNKSLQFFQRSLKIRMKIYGENNHSTADALQNIGCIYFSKCEQNKALQYYQRSLKIYINILGENHNSTANTLNNIGIIYKKKADYNKALQYLQRSLKIKLKILGEDHINTANTLQNIGLVYAAQKKYSIAQSYFTRCYKIRVKIFGPYNESTIQIKQEIDNCKLKISFS